MSGAMSITDNGSLIFNSNVAQTIVATIAGSGNLSKTGTGTTTLLGNNTVSGSATVSAGTLVLGGANDSLSSASIAANATLQVGNGFSGSIAGATSITDNGSLVFNAGSSQIVSAAIGGTGSISKTGFGITTLSGNNTLTGALTVSLGTLELTGTNNSIGAVTTNAGGTLSIGNGGNTGSLTATSITDNGVLKFNTSNDFTFSTAITGSGSVAKDGTSTVTLGAVNSYTGGTQIADGAIKAGVAGALPANGAVSLSGNGVLDLNGYNTTLSALNSYSSTSGVTLGAAVLTVGNSTGSDSYFAGNISGTGSLVKTGSSMMTLANNNSFTGTTTISGGILQLGDGGAAGSVASSTIINNATLVSNIGNVSGPVTLASKITGTGGLDVNGSGTLILTGANDYTGATNVNGNSFVHQGGLQMGGAGTLSNQTVVTVGDGAVFDLAGTSQTIGGLAGVANSSVKLGAGSLTTGGLGTSTTFAGVMSGTAASSFTKAGTGTMIMSGANTTSGSYQVSSGSLILTGANDSVKAATVSAGATLQLGNNTASGSLALASIQNDGTLNFNRTDSLDVNSGLSGGGLVNQIGTGTTTLTANNTSTGTYQVTAGKLILAGANDSVAAVQVNANSTLQIGKGAATGSVGTATLTNSGTLIFNSASNMTIGNVIAGAGLVTQDGTGTTTLTGNNTSTGAYAVTAGKLVLGGANDSVTSAVINPNATLQIGAGLAAGSIASAVITDNGTLSFNRSDAFTYGNAVAGTGGVTQIGTGTTTLSADNTFAGPVDVTKGKLILTGSNTTTAAATIAANSVLQIGNNTGTGSLASSSIAIAATGELILDRNNALAVTAALSGAGALSQIGTGTSTLSGNNTGFTGTATVTDGTLKMGSASALSASNALTVNGGTFDLGGFNTTVGSVAGTGGTLALGSNTLTEGGNNATTLFSGSVTGAGGNFTKVGTGTTTLAGTNTFSGAATVNAGTLIMEGANNNVSTAAIASGATLQLGAGGATGSLDGATSIANNGTLSFNRADTTQSIAAVISGPGLVSQQGTGTTTLTGDNSSTGTYQVTTGKLILTGTNDNVSNATVAANAVLQIGNGGTTGTIGAPTIAVASTGQLIFDRSNALGVASVISGAGNISQTGAGTTTLSGNNAGFTGTATVTDGALKMGSASALSVANAVTVNGGTFDLGGFDTTVGSVAGTGGTLALGGKTLTAGGDNTTTSFAGSVTGTGGSFTKVGTGTTTLAGNNSFTGAATVNGGKLILSGTNDNLGTASVANGATLQIGDNGSTGTIGASSINVATTGTLIFDRTDPNLSVGAVISGGGLVNQQGTGTTTLTGNNTATGTYQVTAGKLVLGGANDSVATATIDTGAILQIGNGGTSGSLATAAITDNGTLNFNRSDATTYSGVLTGSGGVNQVGAGPTTLPGDNLLTGAYQVSAGKLILTGTNDNVSNATVRCLPIRR